MLLDTGQHTHQQLTDYDVPIAKAANLAGQVTELCADERLGSFVVHKALYWLFQKFFRSIEVIYCDLRRLDAVLNIFWWVEENPLYRDKSVGSVQTYLFCQLVRRQHLPL